MYLWDSVMLGEVPSFKIALPFGSQSGLYYTFDQNFDSKIRRANRKDSYEHRVYESVGDMNISSVLSHKVLKTELGNQRDKQEAM